MEWLEALEIVFQAYNSLMFFFGKKKQLYVFDIKLNF